MRFSRGSGSTSWRLCLSSLLFALAISLASGQTSQASTPPSPPSGQTTPSSLPPSLLPPLINPDGTLNLQNLDQALQQASATAQASATSDSELPGKYKSLLTQYTDSLSLIKKQDQDNQAVQAVDSKLLSDKDKAIAAALRRSNIWEDATFVMTGAAAGSLAAGPKGALEGAAGGLAAAGIHELSRMLRLWR